MANAQMQFDASFGALAQYARNAAAATGGAKFQWMLLKSSGLEADATLQTYATVSALLAAANDEATFAGYARLNVTAGHITVTVDTTNHWVTVDITDDPTWSPTAAEALGKIVLIYNPTGSSADSACIPMNGDVWTITTPTSGSIVFQLPSGGFFKAKS